MRCWITRITLLTSILLISCHGWKKQKEQDQKFVLNDIMMKMIALDTARLSVVEEDVRLIGQVCIDEEKAIRIFPLVSGFVTNVNVELGDEVKKGQVLAVIKSSEMADIGNNYVTAKSNLAVAQKNESSMEEMYKGGIASEKDFIASQKDLQKAESELSRIESIISIYGGVDGKSDYVVRSPADGFVVEKNINPNMQIRTDNNDRLFTLSDLNHLWVIANVYEIDIPKITAGRDVEITTISYPDKFFSGKIDKVYNVLDPENKTMKVRIQLENPKYLLKPGMFANVRVDYHEDIQMICIPSDAIVFDKSKYFAMVFHSKDSIETRRINIYKISGSSSYIRSGINQKDLVISKNTLIIYGALNN